MSHTDDPLLFHPCSDNFDESFHRKTSRQMRRTGWYVMALGFYFVHGGFTPDKYEEAIKQLAAAGQGAPKGRTLHVALESNGEIHVFDLWESQETFDAFGATLMPILAGLDIKLNEPMVAHVHNVIEG
jgi:hypothetical protein